MGQNGAGKVLCLGFITGKFKPEDGDINIATGSTIALSRQVIPRDEMDLTVREFLKNVS